MPPAPRHLVTFVAAGVGRVSAVLGQSAPKISDGNPIWETVDRPKRPSLVLWRGRKPVQLTVPIVFDGLGSGDSVEQAITTLDRMKRSPATGQEPPTVEVNGAVPRRDIKNWVITDIAWGDDVVQDIIGGSPVRLRQDATVTLIEKIEDERLSRYQPTTKKNGPKHPFHTVKSGETLPKISQIEYGDVKHVAAIRKANNLADSKAIKVGQRLRMPA